MSSTLATKITCLLFVEQSNLQNLVKRQFADDVVKDVDVLLNRYHQTLSNHLQNAVRVPGDDGEQHGYPSRETLRADDPLLPVPDPAETETSQESKTSIPDYSEYQENIRVLEASGQTLWNDEAGDTDKVQSIKDAREAMNNILGMLKQF